MDAHGTLVASIIGGRREEGSDGMWGLAPDCTMLTASHGMPIHALARLQGEILAKNPKASMADIQKEMVAHAEELRRFGDTWIEFVFSAEADAIRYLADHNARVINISGFLETTRLAAKPELKARFEGALAYAKEKDVIIVLASGNNDGRVTDYPGDHDFVIVAGASTLADKRWTMSTKVMGTDIRQGSSYGPRLSVVAPIENIVHAVPHEEAYYSWNDTPMGRQKESFEAAYAVAPWGATSLAAPQVAALAALVRTIRPDLKAREVIRLIEQGADDLAPAGFDEETGYGRINFLKTLELARKAVTSQ
jgi:subtilisin family serine protease